MKTLFSRSFGFAACLRSVDRVRRICLRSPPLRNFFVSSQQQRTHIGGISSGRWVRKALYMNEALDDLKESFDKVAREIDKTELQIEGLSDEIASLQLSISEARKRREDIDIQILSAEGSEQRALKERRQVFLREEDLLREDLKQLRIKEEQLRREKEQLRREKELLLIQQQHQQQQQQQKELLLMKQQQTVPEALPEAALMLKARMEKFFSLCRTDLYEHPALSLNAMQQHDMNATIEAAPDRITVVNVSLAADESPVIQAYVLPEEESWPLFYSTKQQDAPSPSIYLHRLGRPHDGRYAETLQQLLVKRRKVAWLGASGIGKSTGVHFVLMQLLRHLGEEGWPQVVALRVNGFLTSFACGDGTNCTVNVKPCKLVMDISDASVELKKRNGVLLVELEEEENHLTSFCPLLFTVSNRNAQDDFKSLDKSGLQWMLVDPWSNIELRCAALCLHAAGYRFTQGGKRCDSIDAMMDFIHFRYEEVGGLPRYVLGGEEAFDKRIFNQDGVKASDLFSDLDKNKLFSMTPSGKFFLAPWAGDDVEVPLYATDTWQWRFLSLKRARAAAKYCTGIPSYIAALAAFGVEYQVEEAMVKCALSNAEGLDRDHYGMGNWQWYEEIGGTLIERESPLERQFNLSKSIFFRGRMYEGDVRKLDPTALYESDGWQMILGDMFFVCHETKKLYMVQVSKKRPKQHGFRVENVADVAAALRLEGSANEDAYDLVIIYVMDKSRSFSPITNGLRFDGNSLDVVRSQFAFSIEGLIVRGNTLPGQAVKSSNDDIDIVMLQRDGIQEVTIAGSARSKKCRYHLYPDCQHLSRTKITHQLPVGEMRQGEKLMCKLCVQRFLAGNKGSSDD